MRLLVLVLLASTAAAEPSEDVRALAECSAMFFTVRTDQDLRLPGAQGHRLVAWENAFEDRAVAILAEGGPLEPAHEAVHEIRDAWIVTWRQRPERARDIPALRPMVEDCGRLGQRLGLVR